MKKKISIFLIMVLSAFIYAETYEELLKKAEQYETKKEWFFALGSYYDANKISNGSDIAREKFSQLCDCISNGNPGYGSYNDFTLHDEWVNLIKNAEKYFTETFPYSITFDDLTSSSLNYEKKTADYKLSLEVKNSSFYDTALNILRTGYQKVRRADWNDLESDTKELWFMKKQSDVGYVGIHNTGIMSYPTYIPIFTGTYKVSVYNTKYTTFEKSNELTKLQTDSNSIYKKDGVALSYFASTLVPLSSYYSKKYPGIKGIGVCEAPAFVAKFSTNGWKNRNLEMSIGDIEFLIPFYYSGKQTCYDLKLGIYDEKGNLVIEGTRQTICTDNFSYNFNNIPQSKLAIFDSDYDIKIIGIWLNYGVYDITLLTDDDIKNDTIRGIVKPLPDIKINIRNVDFNGGEAWFSKKAAIAEKKRIELKNARFTEYNNGKNILLEDFVDYITEIDISKPLIVEGNAENINFADLKKAINQCSLDGIMLDLSNITDLTIIPESAFANCEKLKSIKLPDTIISIEENAFYNCKNLESFIFPRSIQKIGKKAFAVCTSLRKIDLPDTITELPEGLFSECSSLQEINLSNKVNKIGSGCFSGCEQLKSINLQNEILEISEELFLDCKNLEQIVFSEKIEKISKKAFANCLNLRTIIIPNSVTEIADRTFMNCENLESIKLSENLTSLGSSVFSGCDKLKSLILPEGITTVGFSVFANSKISEIKLPESLQEIQDGAFEDCPLSTVIYAGSSKQWKQVVIDKKANKKFMKLKVQFEKN